MDENAIKQIQKVFKDGIAGNELAGGNLLVIHRDREILYHEDGLADIEKGLPIRRDSIFRLYSMTKPMTAAAVMLLMERGEIDLFEPVSKFLPGFMNQQYERDGHLVPVERDATLKDLLSMTSGLVYDGNHMAGKATEALFRDAEARLMGDHPIATVELMNRLGQCPLAFHPGASWAYGTSADVLGAVVEVVSGMRYGDFLKSQLFEPLGMRDTGFHVPADKRNRLVTAYREDDKGKLTPYTGNDMGILSRMDRDPAYESGGGGLVSTIDDSSRFARMLMHGGCLDGVRILSPKTVAYMTTGALSPDQQKAFDRWFTLSGHSYGNMMRVMKDCGKAGFLGSPGEYGWDGWMGAYFCNCPADDLMILFMMQKTDSGTTPMTRKLRNIIMSNV